MLQQQAVQAGLERLAEKFGRELAEVQRQLGQGRPLTLEEVEKAHISEVLASCGGNKTKAARILGVNRATLRRKGY